MSKPQVTCCYCSQKRQKIKTTKKLMDGSYVYVDEKNKKWAGKRCPRCERFRVKSALKYNKFKRYVVIQQLKLSGFTILSHSYPIEVNKNNKNYLIGIRYAYLNGEKIVFEKTEEKFSCDFYAVLFQGVRFLSNSKFKLIASKTCKFTPLT